MNRVVTAVRSGLRRIALIGRRENHHTELHRQAPHPDSASAAQYRYSPDLGPGASGYSGFSG